MNPQRPPFNPLPWTVALIAIVYLAIALFAWPYL